MKIVKFLKIVSFFAIIGLSFSVGTAEERFFSEEDFDSMQFVKRILERNEYEPIIKAINAWDDAEFEIPEQLIDEINTWDDFTNAAIVRQLIVEAVKGEIVSEFIERGKAVYESAKQEIKDYRERKAEERHERERAEQSRSECRTNDKLERYDRYRNTA